MSPSRSQLIVLPLVLCVGLLTGACAVPVAVTAGSYAADAGLYAATDKTSGEHLTSMVTKKDCGFFRVFRGQTICRERVGDHDPYDVNYNEAYRAPSEDGVQYGTPLRPASDAPAASWDAATYMPAPPAPATPSEPATAVADAPPTLQAAPPPPAAPKAAKPKKGRSAKKKTSRGQAASAL